MPRAGNFAARRGKAPWNRPRARFFLRSCSRGRSSRLYFFDRTVLIRKSATDSMLQAKNTLRATVYLSFEGRVYKTYHGPDAQDRFANEVRVLRHLEARGCGFVPRLLETDPAAPRIVTTSCGQR